MLRFVVLFQGIVGHDAQKSYLSENVCLFPCWILAGVSGIGKFAIAMEVARHFTIGHEDDLLVVSNKVLKMQDVAMVNSFLSISSANGYKVVVIDNFDTVTYGAANSLLKILETPLQMQLVLIVVSTLSKVVPAIRSRCNVLLFGTLRHSEMLSLINDDAVIEMSNGSVGRAKQIMECGGTSFYKSLLCIPEQATNYDPELVIYMKLFMLNRRIKILQGIKLNEFFVGEFKKLRVLGWDVDVLLHQVSNICRYWDSACKYNLDKKYICNL